MGKQKKGAPSRGKTSGTGRHQRAENVPDAESRNSKLQDFAKSNVALFIGVLLNFASILQLIGDHFRAWWFVWLLVPSLSLMLSEALRRLLKKLCVNSAPPWIFAASAFITLIAAEALFYYNLDAPPPTQADRLEAELKKINAREDAMAAILDKQATLLQAQLVKEFPSGYCIFYADGSNFVYRASKNNALDVEWDPVRIIEYDRDKIRLSLPNVMRNIRNNMARNNAWVVKRGSNSMVTALAPAGIFIHYKSLHSFSDTELFVLGLSTKPPSP